MQGIDDAIAHEGVDHQALLVGGVDLFLVGVQRLIALVEGDDLLPGQLEAEARGVDQPFELAEPQHDGALALVDHEEEGPAQHQDHDQQQAGPKNVPVEGHWPPPDLPWD